MALQTFTDGSSTSDANAHSAGAGLYSISDHNVTISVLGKPFQITYPKASPKGTIDIHKDFYWSNGSSDKSEVPCIYAEEFEVTLGQTVTTLQRLFQGVSQVSNGKFADPYLTMYSGEPTGFHYRFPHLLKAGDNLRELKNSWTNKDGMDALKTVGKVAGLGKGMEWLSSAMDLGEAVIGGIAPGFGFEETYKYAGTDRRSLKISFPLYNTKDTLSAFKNYCFCLLFAFQNMKTRTTFMTYLPPKLYTLTNPYNGGVYMPVAVVNSFSIDSIGTTRILSDQWNDGITNNPIIIPEAYKVTIVFEELIPESTNIMIGSMGGNKISVINNNAGQYAAQIGDAISKFLPPNIPPILSIAPPTTKKD